MNEWLHAGLIVATCGLWAFVYCILARNTRDYNLFIDAQIHGLTSLHASLVTGKNREASYCLHGDMISMFIKDKIE